MSNCYLFQFVFKIGDIPGAASKTVAEAENSAKEDEFGAKDYRSLLTLKLDYKSRPLWVVRSPCIDDSYKKQ